MMPVLLVSLSVILLIAVFGRAAKKWKDNGSIEGKLELETAFQAWGSRLGLENSIQLRLSAT
jgi:hypothetical protein